MTAAEYRVRWRRDSDDGFPDTRPPRFKIYQKRKDAERWIAILKGTILEHDGVDPDDYACCAGYDCGCRGETNRERVESRYANVPPLIEGPTLQVREVGQWREAA